VLGLAHPYINIRLSLTEWAIETGRSLRLRLTLSSREGKFM